MTPNSIPGCWVFLPPADPKELVLSWFYVKKNAAGSEQPYLHHSYCSSSDRQKIHTLVGWYTNPELAQAAAREIYPQIKQCSCCRQQQPIDTLSQPIISKKGSSAPHPHPCE
jgi:hypothetical protein